MKKKSLQKIEDFYKNQGYTGDSLRRVLAKDKEWTRLVKERKQKLTKKVSLTNIEKKKYVMATDEDYEILGKVKQLEKTKLSKEDKALVKLIRTQLEHDWRKPLIKTLNKLIRRCNKKK